MQLNIKKTIALFVISCGLFFTGAYAQDRPGDKPGANTDPAKWHNEGIYYYNPEKSGNPFMLIDPSTSNGSKSGGYGQQMASAWSGGLASSSDNAIIKGEHSQSVIYEKSPVFYFYCEKDNISPKLFVLVKFIQKRGDRLMSVGKHNAYGSSEGVNEKQVVDIGSEKLSDGIFKVYPKQKLEVGEYCFYYIGNAESNFAGGFYDFGISDN